MKLMLSQPMKGKTTEQIKGERAELVAVLEAQGHSVVDTVFTDAPPETDNIALWHLGKSLEAMASCEGVVFMPGWENARGCRIEHEAAARYGLFVQEV